MKSNTIKKLAAALLALVMAVGLLPTAALAAESDPPDWNFLVLFVPMDADYEENGATKHVKTALSDSEVNKLISQLVEFESVMIESGVMKPHFAKYKLSLPITNLSARSSYGPYPTSEDVADMLKDYAIDLDAYDHVFVFGRMDGVEKSYGGITPREVFDNGTTYTFLSAEYLLWDYWDTSSTPKRPAYVILHEFLHTMEVKPGCGFALHSIEADIVPNYPSDASYKACMLDIIHNRITGTHGSGVVPSAWSYSSTVLRALRELTIPNGTTEIKDNACQYMFNLSRVTIPNSVKSIGKSAFRGTPLTKVTISDGVTSIDDFAFADCAALTEITIPDSVQSMGGSVFDRCSSLQRITLPKNITAIPTWTFTFCSSLTEISIPAGVTKIDTGAFYGCSGLKRIYIPASVTTIAGWAFNLSGVKDIYYGGTEEQWNTIIRGTDTGTNLPLTTATIHYSKEGTLGDTSELAWKYDPSLGQVTISGSEVSKAEPVYAAVYGEGGKMTGVIEITAPGGKADVGRSFNQIKLIWVDQNTAPKCTYVEIAS